jgi:dTDP-4-amino-4,6-dideoxygalactose transaminase
LTTTAKLPHAWEFKHDEIGYNYRLPNLNAALGCAQLEQLPGLLAAKRDLFRRYQAAFAPLSGIRLIAEPEQCHSNYWLQTLALSQEYAEQRDILLQVTNDAGFMTRPAWTLMNELRPFRDCPRMDLAGAQSLSSRMINIPSSSSLTRRTS